VCRAIIDEYVDEVMPLPTTAPDWKRISDGFLEKWNFPHTLDAFDGKHIACKCPPSSGSTYFNYKKYYSIVLLALVDTTTSSFGPTSEAAVLHLMLSCGTSPTLKHW
jgi:hypothetical protein